MDKKYKIIKDIVSTLGITIMLYALEKAGLSFGWAILFVVGHAMTQVADYMRIIPKCINEKD